MAQPSEMVFMEGFAAGEYGSAASWQIGWRLLRQQLLYAGYFTARNAQRSLHSTLYPRSGLVDISPSGVPNGLLTGFVWTDVPNRDLLFSIGSAVYDCPSVAGGAATVYTGAFAITPTVPVAFAPSPGGLVYASVYGDKTYVIDQNARTVLPLARVRVTDAVTTNTSPNFSSVTMGLTSFDVGRTISTPNFPVGTTILSQTGTAGVASANATASGSGQTMDIGVAPGCACIAVFNDKLMLANQSGHANRVFFSGDDSVPPISESNYHLWDPLNFLDVGDLWNINGLAAQRTALVIAKQRSWYLLTGVPGVNDVLRPLNQNGPWPQAPTQMAMAGDNIIWFVDFNKDVPTAFNGAKLIEESTLSFNGGVYAFTALPPTFAVARGYRNDDVILAAVTTPGGAMNAAFYRDGAWTFQTFNPPGGFNGCWLAGKDGHSAGMRMSNGGGVSTPAKFYGWVTNRDRPPISGQPLESIGDASNTPLAPTITFPEYYLRGGQEMKVRGVLVDFVRWNDGYGPNNHFDCQVQALDIYGDIDIGPGGPGAVLTRTFDRPASEAGSVGQSKPGRVYLGFDGEMGNGWQVSFAGCVGIEIKKLEIHFILSELRGL